MDCPRSHYILGKSGMLPLFISYYCSLSINPQKLQKLRNHVVLFPMITFLFISNPFYFHSTEYTDSEMPDLLWNNVCLVSQLCLGLCDLLDCSQAPLSKEFPRREYWSGFPFPPPGDLPHPRIQPMPPVSPELTGGFFTTKMPDLLLNNKYSWPSWWLRQWRI